MFALLCDFCPDRTWFFAVKSKNNVLFALIFCIILCIINKFLVKKKLIFLWRFLLYFCSSPIICDMVSDLHFHFLYSHKQTKKADIIRFKFHIYEWFCFIISLNCHFHGSLYRLNASPSQDVKWYRTPFLVPV